MFYRLQGWLQTPTGNAVPGASVAILTQPADTTTEPGTPLASLYSASSSNSATVTNAVWSGQQITFTLNSVPADVIPGSYIGVSGASPSGYNSTLSAPWLVVSVSGLNVVVLSIANPGTYSSGGTVATSLQPNPVLTDGNGFWFGYASSGIYTTQIYGATLQSQLVYPDQECGTSAGGSVTSVAMTMPGVLFNTSVSGSPITTSGTLAPSLVTQSANKVLAGPTSGGAATPTFRSLVAADLPGGSGTVSSVALTLTVPSFLSAVITGSPVTTTGTLAAAVTLANQNANLVFAGPASGGASAPTFRSLAPADIPGITGFATATIHEDFMCAQYVSSVTTVVPFSADELWGAVEVAAAFTLEPATGSFNNPGILAMLTGTSSGNGGVIFKSLSASAALVAELGALGSNAGWQMDFYVNLASAANCSLRMGACVAGENAVDPPTEGIWCDYDTANGSDATTGTTYYTLRCVTGSTSTYAQTTVVPTVSYDHIRIFSTTVGTIGMSVNGGTAVTVSTNVPTSVLGIFIQGLTRTSASKTFNLDAVSYFATTTRS